MKGEGYKTTASQDKTIYRFDSVGIKRTIRKVVAYFQIDEDTWNLAFGDATEDDDFDDEVVSDNGDLVKVFQTVVNTIYDFTDKYPDRKVSIEPLDGKRSIVYHAILERKWTEIKADFQVFGYVGKAKEPYLLGMTYDKFVVVRKKITFGN